MASPLTGLKFNDVYLRPGRATLQRLPAKLRRKDVRALTDSDGVIPRANAGELEQIGRKVFRLLFRKPGALAAVRQGQRRKAHVRTRFWVVLNDPKTHAQPWEIVSDPRSPSREFVALDSTISIVRTWQAARNQRPLRPIDAPIRVLAIVASPKDLPALAVADEKEALSKALQSGIDMGLLELNWIEGTDTSRQVREAFRNETYHIVHFIGHGDYNSKEKIGELAFEDERGDKKLVSADMLVYLLRPNANVRLVVLNACRGAFAGSGGLLTSTAARIARDVPAVIAMQTKITDPAAVLFSQEFYGRLLEGFNPEMAVAEARFSLELNRPEPLAIEWPSPVVYLSTRHNVLNLSTIKAAKPPDEKSNKSKTAASSKPKRAKKPAEKPTPPVEDDPQKGRWGERAATDTRRLTATVETIDRDWFRIHLTVSARRGKKPLNGNVVFHLHDSFQDPVQTVKVRDGEATLTLVAYGAFTVGAEADKGRTRLELDLAELKSAPKKFRNS
jgi:hypothetical protein